MLMPADNSSVADNNTEKQFAIRVLTYSEQTARKNGLYVYKDWHYFLTAMAALCLMAAAVVVMSVLFGNAAMLIGLLVFALLIPVPSLIFTPFANERLAVFCFKGNKAYVIRMDPNASTDGGAEWVSNVPDVQGAESRSHDMIYIRELLNKIDDGSFKRDLFSGGTARVRQYFHVEQIEETDRYSLYQGTDSKGRIHRFKIKHVFDECVI